MNYRQHVTSLGVPGKLTKAGELNFTAKETPVTKISLEKWLGATPFVDADGNTQLRVPPMFEARMKVLEILSQEGPGGIDSSVREVLETPKEISFVPGTSVKTFPYVYGNAQPDSSSARGAHQVVERFHYIVVSDTPKKHVRLYFSGSKYLITKRTKRMLYLSILYSDKHTAMLMYESNALIWDQTAVIEGDADD